MTFLGRAPWKRNEGGVPFFGGKTGEKKGIFCGGKSGELQGLPTVGKKIWSQKKNTINYTQWGESLSLFAKRKPLGFSTVPRSSFQDLSKRDKIWNSLSTQKSTLSFVSLFPIESLETKTTMQPIKVDETGNITDTVPEKLFWRNLFHPWNVSGVQAHETHLFHSYSVRKAIESIKGNGTAFKTFGCGSASVPSLLLQILDFDAERLFQIRVSFSFFNSRFLFFWAGIVQQKENQSVSWVASSSFATERITLSNPHYQFTERDFPGWISKSSFSLFLPNRFIPFSSNQIW